MSVEELTHTADVRIRVRSSSLPGLFSEAARGMFLVMFGECSGEREEVTFELEAGDRDALVHDFLSELLYLSEVRGIVFCSFDVTIRDTGLSATVRGIPFDRERHAGGREIKGVSYSGLRIVKEQESYCMDVIFDV